MGKFIRQVQAVLALSVLMSTAVFAAERGAGSVDEARMQAATSEPDNWLAEGRDQEGTYYSPLTTLNDKNVGDLGFAWQYDLGTYRGQEATPVVVDGVLYTSGTWGYVYALDA